MTPITGVILILIGVILLIGEGLIVWKMFHQTDVPAVAVDPDIHAAVVEALAECGVNAAFIDPSADLLRTGKFDDVLYHASGRLGQPLRTTADLIAILTRHFR